MKLAPVALLLTLSAAAQQTFTDPANLRGERAAPLTGRELPIDQGSLGLQQLLRKLNTRASILNIVAHPDDEDGGMMTLYSRGLGARVADLSLTRGEGGQNAVTGDFEDALGLLRTQELLSSDRYPGIDQFFGTEVDFGFSKTKEESFAKWTHERVLYDVVRAIRLYRPLVLTSTWIGGVTDGHGQHQVSGQIAQEAFVAAGDPKVFPELTAEGILPWQPLRIYARVPMQSISEKGLFDYATGEYTPARFTNYVTGAVTTTPPTTDVVVHEGTPDPLLADETGKPRSYVQFARIGLGLQKSQVGPGMRVPSPGAFDVNYHLYGTAICEHNAHSTPALKNCHPEQREGPASPPAAALQPDQASFFDGIDTTITGILSLVPSPSAPLRQEITKLDKTLANAATSFNPAQPGKIAPQLADALNQTDNLITEVQQDGIAGNGTKAQDVLHELRVKRVQLEQALALALNIKVKATTTSADLLAATPTHANVRIDVPNEEGLKVMPLVMTSGFMKQFQPCMPAGEPEPHGAVIAKPFVSPITRDCVLPARFTETVTRPYFERPNIEQAVYELLDPQLRNAPATPEALSLYATFQYRNAQFEVAAVAEYQGQPAQIVPLASVTAISHAQVLATTQPSVVVSLQVSPPGTRVEGEFPDHWKVTPDIEPKQSPPGFSQLRLEPPAGPRSATTLKAIAVLPHGVEVHEGYRPVGYGDLPRINYFTPATDRIVPVDLKLPNKHRIAYLPGTGDSIPEALASIGLTPTTLTVSDLTSTNLAQYDTVILGVRTYNAHPDLHGTPTQALLNYAKNGGNVVIQYQTAEFTSDDAPYPLTLGRDAEKVVDETDPVQLLTQNSPAQNSKLNEASNFTLLTTPNKITPSDFNNWIEERGHSFLQTWDPHYTALTEVHDPGQAPQRGGLITTQLGKGRWTYVAFALYRQLPEAVPGAYRLFLNLLNP